MPDEREMEEIHEVMEPPPAPLSRHERRQQMRESSRTSGIVTCDLCGFPLELEHEPRPKDCPACGFPYDRDNVRDEEALERVALERRRCSALESLADAAAGIAEGQTAIADGFRDFIDVIGSIAAEIKNLRQGQARASR
jgi:hypothetical protein